MKRTFIALEFHVPQNVIDILESFKKEIAGLSVKWVEIYNMHITLAFFGKTNPVQIHNITSDLKYITEKYSPLQLHLKGLGIFGSISDPKVVWVGIEPDNELYSLAENIHGLFQSNGFETDNREFKPHLTLGRIKKYSGENNLNAIITRYTDKIDENVPADKIIFYESNITSTGPVYRTIKAYQLTRFIQT